MLKPDAAFVVGNDAVAAPDLGSAAPGGPALVCPRRGESAAGGGDSRGGADRRPVGGAPGGDVDMHHGKMRFNTEDLTDGFAKPTRISGPFSVASSGMDRPPAADQSVSGWTDVTRARSDQAAHRSLFGDVRTPANDARRGKHRREERSRDAHSVEQYCGVELNVARVRAPDVVRRGVVRLHVRPRVQSPVGRRAPALEPRRGAFQCRGAWIADTVDACPMPMMRRPASSPVRASARVQDHQWRRACRGLVRRATGAVL